MFDERSVRLAWSMHFCRQSMEILCNQCTIIFASALFPATVNSACIHSTFFLIINMCYFEMKWRISYLHCPWFISELMTENMALEVYYVWGWWNISEEMERFVHSKWNIFPCAIDILIWRDTLELTGRMRRIICYSIFFLLRRLTNGNW
jgi:hypothetical protein